MSRRALSCLLLLAPGLVAAQSSLAVLRGTVTDPSGALIPGVTIALTEPATGVTVRTVASDATGNYEIPDLKPGAYRLDAEIQGFKKFVSENVLLETGQIRRVNIPLELGTTTESVTVVAGSQVITTDSGNISGRFNKDQYEKSPFVDVYPSPFAMFSTQPGVQGAGWGVVVAGQPRSQMLEAMDGAHARAQGQTNNTNFMDEVSINIVNAPAESSRVVSYNMVSKRGQNELHGMAYYEHFDSALNAKTFFEREETPFLQHEWQLELGGPIVPAKTFFYGSWAAQRLPKGSFNLATAPTASMRQGDFSQLAQTIVDPLTGVPFPGNRIPRDRMSAVSLSAQDLYIPLPNRGDATTLSRNLEWVHPYHWDYFQADWPFVRIDHNLTKNNSLYARWMQRRTPYVLVTNLPQFFWTRMRDHRRMALEDTHVVSSSVVNTVRFSYSTDFIEDGRETDGQQPINGPEAVAAIGLQGVNPRGHNTAGFPAINITGFSSLSTVIGGVKSDDYDMTFEESLTWMTGRHVWKLGAQYLKYEGFSGVVPNYGTFSFNGRFTGHPYADFLLGIPFTSSRVDPLVNRRRTGAEIGFYAQDSIKISPKLTVDYGLRWDYFPSPRFEDGLMYNWDRTAGAVIVPREAIDDISPLYPANIAIREGDVIATADKGNFRPRVSFAYRLNDKSVVRGGYGAFSERLDYFAFAQGGGPFQIAETYQNIVRPGEAPLFTFPNPFPPSLALARVPSQSVDTYPAQTDNGTIHQFNMSLEREIAGLGLRVSYIGSRSNGLNYGVNMNKPEPSPVAFTPERRPSPQFVNTVETRSDGREKYDAFQMQARRRAGLVTFDAHYTWARNLANHLNRENPYDVTSRWYNTGATGGLPTRRHYGVVSTQWTIPVGRGMKYLADTSPVVDRILGGWSIYTVSYFGSGTFFTPSFAGFDPSNTGTFGGIPDRIGAGNLSAGERTPDRWFNPGDFAVPPPGRFGDAGVNILEGMGLNVHHLTLNKDTRLAGRTRFVFTATASNVFNRAHFENPNANISTASAGQISAVMSDFQAERAGRRQVTLKAAMKF
jgi:hypothetical protein